jgi:tRNA (guanine-N7-)-methyltransferase
VTTQPAPERRPIRSFVLREGRITEAQRRAFAGPWQRFGLNPAYRQPLDLTACFGNSRPVTLEIGFGNGEALLELAERHPERNWLGIEVHRPGVGHLLLRLDELGLDNVRVLRQDAMEVLRRQLADASLEAVQLFFPDPWHKKRHHKRRIVQPEFADLLARRLRPGGLVHMATDWEHYARHMLAVFDTAPEFRNLGGADGFAERGERPLTKFEQRGQRLGHGTWDLRFQRR